MPPKPGSSAAPQRPGDDGAAFRADPFGFLAAGRARHGAVVPVRRGAPVFSRAADCPLVVAAFGADAVRQVLTDDAFVMPPSAAGALALPPRLGRLNRSLHSMRGDDHALHRRAIARLLVSPVLDAGRARAAMSACSSGWLGPQPLLARARELVLALAGEALLGPGADPALAPALQRFFRLRREAASPASPLDARAQLLEAGHELDRRLRHHLRRGGGLLGSLCDAEAMGGLQLGLGEAAGHANILFISATEPVAVALAWTLLLLSQSPRWLRLLREEPVHLDDVVAESLRLLPPNAFMVRRATRELVLAGFELPAGSEVMLCPLLAHREATVFDRPLRFDPLRWRRARPSAYEYLPFGAGTHACVGRTLGLALLREALAFVLSRWDPVLDEGAAVDWRLHVQFMPTEGVSIRFEPASVCTHFGRWTGGAALLADPGGDAPD